VAQRELGSLLTRRDECGRYGPDSANTLHDAATTLPKSMGSYPMPRRHAREVQPADTRAYEHGAPPAPSVDARENGRGGGGAIACRRDKFTPLPHQMLQ